ncbi:efflux RND transporter periplasmic adaptor subunit [Nannocystis sp. ILAH1]|uniref:efflux RND transporter periplasmic adaptor subunit n=1 Tax=Nannocystis sp. ILAH1 TaxID=2996789 RepID=UPI00226F7C7B|nr:efflux RND transporter periplasmic adaptor subunit [Nannocystis sp. ILAH1]MCY0989781.1 efflux RND transporter periplasmic adaptor subunit [Nannocystis sp. ILAH1]
MGWALAFVVLAGGTGVAVAMRPKPVLEAERYRSEPATRGALVHEVSATGHLEARKTVSVGPEISGRIASVEVDFNDHVVRGQVLARFDKTSLDAEAERAHASLQVARTALAEAEVAAKQTARERRRVEALYLSGAVSAAERDATVSGDEQSAARVRSARAQLGLQQAGGRIVNTNLARAEIHSPIDGIVIRRSVEPGQSVAAAFQSPELFLLAEDLDHMEVRVAIDEADIGQVRAGQRAQFTVDAYPDEAFPAVVTEVRNAAELTQNVVTYEAVLAVDNPGLKLRPGMTASVRVITAEEVDALLVPNAALRFTPSGHEDSRNHADGVFIVGEGGRPRFVPLTIGLTDGALTSVRGDLAAGEPVLVDLAAGKHGKKG